MNLGGKENPTLHALTSDQRSPLSSFTHIHGDFEIVS